MDDLIDRMDPEIAAVIPLIPVLDLTDIPQARRARVRLMEQSLVDYVHDPNVTIEDHHVPGLGPDSPEVRVRCYRPRGASEALPALVWIHGGGHVVGQVEQDDPTLEHFVTGIGCVVLSVDWRRPPEHPFPAPLDDCYAALVWAFEEADMLGIDRRRLAVGGTSSGAGSAAGLALLARDRGEVPVAFQLLMYPMLDDRNVTPSSHLVHDERLWDRQSNLIAWQAYLGDAAGTSDVSPYAAPSRATDLTGLPPAYIAVGTLDLFLDEDIDYAQRLAQAGVPTELHVYPRAPHGFDLFNPKADVSQRYLRDRDDALRRAFAGTTP